ncbi:GAF domain-containing protein [Lentiprolixibacter aurantiacus]|uniref:GAF domain-containing protein n=1 Tax=Lentiprolixibacter aurantiacus TaxID=2993939 RepID=A0AAE3MI19_9FLAO|nr:GAF domain-containing protein [Lentiprolixibacter aurantiacus]MCX2718180.1 GAF domain-containing protein [Lentiprolixibacter aurantiacus]
MNRNPEKDFPIKPLISFDRYLRQYDAMVESEDPLLAAKARNILEAQAPYPELREGFTDMSLLEKHKDVIRIILQDAFSDILGDNEIKAASLPYFNLMFNPSRRFQKILDEAGANYRLDISHREEGVDYMMASTVILKFHYGFNLDFGRPYFYDIPDANGVIRHYRILYNADFMDLYPTELAKDLNQDDLDQLLENPDNLELWKEKIPPGSFISKGFVISNMFDVTSDQTISDIKSALIASDKRGNENFMEDLQETFRSFFRSKNLKVGFVAYDPKANYFKRIHGKKMSSFLLHDKETEVCDEALCQGSYEKLLKQNTYFAIPDVEKYYTLSEGAAPYKPLHEQGIKSAILAPIASQGELLGVLEVVSTIKNELNGVNATKLDDVMPYIVSAVVRSKIEEANLIDAVIQNECTSVHESVYWKFREEAQQFITDQLQGNKPTFREIVFENVYPLYGQVDIRSSSRARNEAIQRDMIIQLIAISQVLEQARVKYRLPIYEELKYRVKSLVDDIKEVLHTNSEQLIFNFVQEDVLPVFNYLKETDEEIGKSITAYESTIDKHTGTYYDHRRNYDESVMKINQELAEVLDQKQLAAQEMFPHYFERYKTDGVEHNMYIGESISGDQKFNRLFLNNLRLWELQTMVDMENRYYNLKAELPVKLDIASLILVYNTSLSIRFRMDEKRFDVDGTYNARYEIIKKRIDKSYVKGTNERVTQSGKMVIIYSQKEDEMEYLRYIRFLKSKGYFTNNIEIVELEGLQGVTGLKAIRAEILYHKGKESEKTYTYEELMQELED